MNRSALTLKASLLSVVVALYPACLIAPMRLPTQTKDAAGKEQQLDFTFLKAGKTTSEEVSKKLSPIDTHVNQSNFFWGRWESSNWGYGGIVALPPIGGGAGGSRVWGMRNVFVHFDSQRLVKDWTITDDKGLYRQLDLVTVDEPQDPSLSLHAGVRLALLAAPVQGVHDPPPSNDATLVLSSESVQCDKIRTPRSNLSKITIEKEITSDGKIWVNFHFAKPVLAGENSKHKPLRQKTVFMGMDPATLLAVHRYISPSQAEARK